MKIIPSSVPVFIQDLESQNGKYSKAKLKVFYVGETPDSMTKTMVTLLVIIRLNTYMDSFLKLLNLRLRQTITE